MNKREAQTNRGLAAAARRRTSGKYHGKSEPATVRDSRRMQIHKIDKKKQQRRRFASLSPIGKREASERGKPSQWDSQEKLSV